MNLPKRVEVLAIGDEILDGRVVDTNSVRLAQRLGEVGLHIMQRTAITDDIDIIVREAADVAARGTELCVVSGGLGPTSDDLTAEALARLCGVELMRDQAQAERIAERLRKRGREVSENQLKQADRPRGAEVIVNPVGTAPGFAVTYKGCRFVSLPGVPHEFDTLVENAVMAPLRAVGEPLEKRGLYLFGIIEADADRKVKDIHTRWPQVRLQFRVKFPEIHVTMHAPKSQTQALDEAFAFACNQLDEYAFAQSDLGFAATLLQLLRQNKATLATAESCTGGLMSDMLTDVPGSSDVVMMGIVAYANETKVQLLGVEPATLSAHGAVSEQAVVEMAKGVRKLANTTYGIAVSGIAGPGGATPQKPVGTIWLGIAGPNVCRALLLTLPFDRRGNKQVGAYSGLDMLRRELLSPGQPTCSPYAAR